jgi:hypothetical protein
MTHVWLLCGLLPMAGFCIVEEAGGVVTDAGGKRLDFSQVPTAFAAPQRTRAQLTRLRRMLCAERSAHSLPIAAAAGAVQQLPSATCASPAFHTLSPQGRYLQLDRGIIAAPPGLHAELVAAAARVLPKGTQAFG